MHWHEKSSFQILRCSCNMNMAAVYARCMPYSPMYIKQAHDAYIPVYMYMYISGGHIACVLILLNMCPNTTTCVIVLLYICPHTSIYVSSYYYICVLILRYMCPQLLYMCPARRAHHSRRTVLILLYVSSCYYICVLTLGGRITLDKLPAVMNSSAPLCMRSSYQVF